MKRKRGGQPTHWAERARLLVWYKEVKIRCGWEDRLLDKTFSLPQTWESIPKSSEPPRTFEWINKFARLPRGGGASPYTIHELVSHVNQNPLFDGTQEYFEANFWNILQQQSIAPDDTNKRIDELLEIGNLIRVDPNNHPVISALIPKYGLSPVYDRCIRLSLRSMTILTGLELTWLLYLQNEPVHNHSIRSALEKLLDSRLEAFFYRYFPDENQFLDYSANAINGLLNTKLDLSNREVDGYGFIEIIGTWPIIPKQFLDNISEGYLFPSEAYLGSLNSL